MTLQDMRTYLIVGNDTNEIYDELEASHDDPTRQKAYMAGARQAVKDCTKFYEEQCRIVRAVCDPVSDDCRWSCGKTFAQAEANYRKGICDNWNEF